MNRDRRFSLSQELVGKQTLHDQLGALVGLTRYLMSSLRSAPRLFFDGLWRGHQLSDARRECRPWRHGLRSMDRAECRPIALQPAHRKTAFWTLAGHQLCIDQQPASGTRRA